MAAIADDPRALALALLGGVLEEGRMLSDLENTPPLSDAAPAIRARAGRLARATLRHLGQADAAMRPFLSRPPRSDLRNILRLAIVEMREEGGAAHGVVNAAVHLARTRQPKAAGMVNAVLRRITETEPEAWADLPPQRLPGWLRGRLGAAYGNARVAQMEAVFASTPPLDLTLKHPDQVADWAEKLEAEVLPTGSLRLARPGQISALPGFAEGAWWVQDAAAALPARVLATQPGERVLDLCAAPGGKTLQLAATGAHVTALDISQPRLVRVQENLSRTALAADLVADDALHWAPDAPFDALLLDAPCTATGTLRRHPDLPFVKSKDDIKPLVALQSALLARAADMLRPGGRLVLCTCSLLPEEGEAHLAAANGLTPDTAALDALPGLEAAWRSAPNALRLTPESWAARGGLDGFFIAAFRKMQG